MANGFYVMFMKFRNWVVKILDIVNSLFDIFTVLCDILWLQKVIIITGYWEILLSLRFELLEY